MPKLVMTPLCDDDVLDATAPQLYLGVSRLRLRHLLPETRIPAQNDALLLDAYSTERSRIATGEFLLAVRLTLSNFRTGNMA